MNSRKQTRKQSRKNKKLKRFTKKKNGGVRKGGNNILEKMFSTLSYTNENGETYEIPIVTIPKGTILFRSIKKKSLLNNDYCGIKKVNDSKSENEYDEEEDTSSYCLHKNHNVFFYPYPGYSYNYGDDEGNLTIFVVKRDLKLVNLLLPSKYSRGDRYTLSFLKSCNKIEKSFCDGLQGNSFDPCLTKHFLETNPDINGMYAIAGIDTSKHYMKYNFLQDYSLLNRDRDNIGIPEIILYPFERRMIEEKIWKLPECKEEKNINYYTLFTDSWRIAYVINPSYYKDSEFQKIFHKYLSPTGNAGKHITIFSPLKLFVLWEDLPQKYRKDCVPIIFSWKSKLSQFQKDINKLNDPLYNKHFVVAKTKDYTNNLYLERLPSGLIRPDESENNDKSTPLLNNIKQFFQGETHIPLKFSWYIGLFKSEINIVMLYNSIKVGDIVYLSPYWESYNRYDKSEEFYIFDKESRLTKMSSFQVPDNLIDSDYNTLIVPIDISNYIVTKLGKSIKQIYKRIFFSIFRSQEVSSTYSSKKKKVKTRIIVEVDPNDKMLQDYTIKDKDTAIGYTYGYHNDSWNPSLKISYNDNSETLLFSSDEIEEEEKYIIEKTQKAKEKEEQDAYFQELLKKAKMN